MVSNFNIEAFRAQVKDGHLRNSNFLATMTLPNGFRQNLTLDKDQEFSKTINRVQFYVESAPLPGIGLATDEIRRYGHGNVTLKPYAPIFDTLDIVVRMDAKGKVYDLFQSWMKLIINTDTRNSVVGSIGFSSARAFEVNYKSDYSSIFEMTSFSDEGDAVIKTTMIGAYPTYMGPIQMSWADGSSIAKFPIKMCFEQWYQGQEIRGTTDPAFDQTLTNVLGELS